MAEKKKLPVALAIAGSDSSGGAGVQADLKTFAALGVYGACVVTAITAQNLQGVHAIQAVAPEIVRVQLHAVLAELPVKAVKTGMLLSVANVTEVAAALTRFPGLPLVIDPVMTATTGTPLIQPEASAALKKLLFPRAALLTPNLAEAEFLLGWKISGSAGVEKAAKALQQQFGCPVLLKGGHLGGKLANDILADAGSIRSYSSARVAGVNTHGSGCTLAAAITAALALGYDLQDAVDLAKKFIAGSLRQPLQLENGTKLINHFWKSR